MPNGSAKSRPVLYLILNVGAVALLVIAGGALALAAAEPNLRGMPALAAALSVMAAVLLGTSFLGRRVEGIAARQVALLALLLPAFTDRSQPDADSVAELRRDLEALGEPDVTDLEPLINLRRLALRLQKP